MPDKTHTTEPAQTRAPRTRNSGALTAAGVLAVQRSAGNRAAQRLIAQRQLQARLTVGPVDDPFEREADRMADAVLSSPLSTREGMEAGHMSTPLPVGEGVGVKREATPEEDDLQTKPLAAQITPLAQREAMPEEDEEVQRRAEEEDEIAQTKRTMNPSPNPSPQGRGERVQRNSDGSFDAGADVEQRIMRSKGAGNPLPDATRAEMESKFGADFSGVRVHAGDEAAQLSRDLSAQAFTHGSDVYFGAGKFSPASGEGKHLLAHELTHVMQQRSQTRRTKVRRQVITPIAAGGGFAGLLERDREPKPIKISIVAHKEASRKTIDYWVGALVGHTWIILSFPDGRVEEYGFFPRSLDRKHPWRTVQGRVVRGKQGEHTPSAEFSTWISHRQYQRAVEYANKMSSAKYNLFALNCTSFAREMYQVATGEKAPSGGWVIDDPNDLIESIQKEIGHDVNGSSKDKSHIRKKPSISSSGDNRRVMVHDLTHVVLEEKSHAWSIHKKPTKKRHKWQPQITKSDLIDRLVAANSPLWRQLNPDQNAVVNCPATAASVDEYLSSGHIRPAPAGDATSQFRFEIGHWSEPAKNFSKIRTLLTRPNTFLVVQASRDKGYAQEHATTTDHWFVIVNHRGRVRGLDAYGRGQVIDDITTFVNDQGFVVFRYYQGAFRVIHEPLDLDNPFSDDVDM